MVETKEKNISRMQYSIGIRNILYAVLDIQRSRYSKFVSWPNSSGMEPSRSLTPEIKRWIAETKETNISRVQYSFRIRNILYNVRGRSSHLPSCSPVTLSSSLHVTPYQSHASVQFLSDHPRWLFHEVPTVASWNMRRISQSV